MGMCKITGCNISQTFARPKSSLNEPQEICAMLPPCEKFNLCEDSAATAEEAETITTTTLTGNVARVTRIPMGRFWNLVGLVMCGSLYDLLFVQGKVLSGLTYKGVKLKSV